MSDFDTRYAQWRRTHPPIMGGAPDADESEASTDAAESVQGTVDHTTSTDTPPPWGDDFNAERAWSTISHLRGREKELESDSKALKRLREDEAAQREFLTELGYELPDEQQQESEDYDGDDPLRPINSRLDKFEQWQQQQDAATARAEFNQHLDRLADGKVELDPDDREYLLAQSMKAGFTPASTEKAFEAFTKRRDTLEKQVIERYVKSKRAPAPPQPGKAGEPAIDPNASPQQRAAARRERMAAAMAAEQDQR